MTDIDRGVIYYNRGTKCLVRLAVSLHSLRKVYPGNVCILYEGDLPAWMLQLCYKLKVETKLIPDGLSALLRKTQLWNYAPYQKNLYLDTDTLVLRNPNEILDLLSGAGYGVTCYADWRSAGHKISARIRAWKNVVGPAAAETAVEFGPAVNTGVFYFDKANADAVAFLKVWEDFTARAYAHQDYTDKKIHAKVLDEIGCQIIVAFHPHTMIPETWNRSANHGICMSPGIVHFHGSKHVMPENKWCDLWKTAYWELRMETPELKDATGDKRLRDYLTTGIHKYGTGPVVRKDLTIVTCADTRYAERLTKNFAAWMKVPGLREQNFLIFTLNSNPMHRAYKTLRAYSNVRLVAYASEHHIREAAFSAFVFGTAQHVKTPFWMKLDADAEPTEEGRFEFPEYHKHTITADPWHYTRNKPGFERNKAHWLNRLDDWWGEEQRLFASIIPGNERFGHPRLRSFCWIEKTEFTQFLAFKCQPRLPVPSHDTTSWYVATRKNEPIKAYKFRKWMRA